MGSKEWFGTRNRRLPRQANFETRKGGSSLDACILFEDARSSEISIIDETFLLQLHNEAARR